MDAFGLVVVASLVLAQAPAGDAAEKGAKPAEQASDERPPPDVEKMEFSQSNVKQVIDYHLPKIQACYNELLAGMGPKAPKQGVLNTSWSITLEGLVKGAKVEKAGTTLKDPKLNECVLSVINTMTFPKPAKIQPIKFPFNLKATH